MSVTAGVAADAAIVAMWVVLPVGVLVVGVRNLRASGSAAIGPASLAAGAAGFAVAGAALVPSVGTAAEAAFASHMAQHLALGLAAPLLLAIGRVPELVPWAVPGPRRQDLRRRLGALARPPRSVAWPTAAMVTVWFAWHAPALYGAAVEIPAMHAVEHLSIAGVGVWYWAAVAPHRRRTGAVVFASFALTIALGLLGAALTLSGEPFYGDHVEAASTDAQLADQQLGGLLMWTPGGLVYLTAAVVQLIRWLDVDHTRRVVRAPAPRGTSP